MIDHGDDAMTRVALYARYSADKQNVTSIDHQFHICHEHAARERWKVAGRAIRILDHRQPSSHRGAFSAGQKLFIGSSSRHPKGSVRFPIFHWRLASLCRGIYFLIWFFVAFSVWP
jgi:hypothetical protein